MKIKTKEDLKNYAIKCSNLHEKLEVVRRLSNLGFPICDISNIENKLLIKKGRPIGEVFFTDFEINNFTPLIAETIINFQQFMDISKQFLSDNQPKKEQLPDLEVDDEGRVFKINNWNFPPEGIYYIGSTGIFNKEDVQKLLNLGLLFISKEAKDKALFRLEIEQQLRTIASRLNGEEKIDWSDYQQDKWCINFDFESKDFGCYCNGTQPTQGTIYCLSQSFLSEAIKEIGKDNLIKYFKGE